MGAQLAARGENGQEFHPVAGNYTTTVADASVATVGPALSVVRSYNSLDARRDGLFGAGWSTRYDMRIAAEPSASLLVTYPDGRRLRFAPKGDGSFQAPSGTFATLAEVSGGGWKLMDKSATIYHFTAQGKLSKITDNRGRAQNLSYGTDGKLAKVTAAGGRSLTFTWTGAHVTGVATDPVNGAPLTWTYGYDGDKLISVCHPEAAPNCTSYGYGTGSPYRGLVEDDEPVGYWRLDEPALQPTPTPTAQPTPTACPHGCEPSPTNDAESRGWGAGKADYDQVTLEQPGALAGTGNTAASFSGTSRLRLPDHAIARMADQLSLELWFKTTTNGMLAFAAPSEPVMSGRINDGVPLLYVGTDGKLRGQLRVLQSSGAPLIAPITSAASVANDQWHHAVLAGSGSTQTLYLDGAVVGTLAGTIDHNWLAYATIGHGITAAAWPAAKPVNAGVGLTAWGFAGQIDEVAVYDRALSAGQSAAHYAARAAAPHALKKITLPSGRVWADNTYDPAADRLQAHTDQHGGIWRLTAPSPVDPATGIKTVSYIDPQGGKLSFEHDAWRGDRLKSRTDQRLQKTTMLYDSAGFPQEVNAPNTVVTNTSYDERGNLLATAACTPVTGTAADDDEYDNPYTCFRQSDATHVAARAWGGYQVNADDDFDPRNDQLIAYRDGRSTSSTDNTYATTLAYNQYGQQTKQTTPATLDFPNGRSSEATYTDGSEPAIGGGTTPAGLVKTRIDAKGNTTQLRYRATGDLAEQTAPSGLVTTFEHDALGRVTTQTQISDAHPGGVKTTITYDKLGRPASQTAPAVKNEISGVTHTAKVTYVYDPDGNKLTETVADLTGGDATRTVTSTYDAYGRQDSVTDPEGGVVRTTWNTLGLQATVTDQLGSVFGYTYTERGELHTKTLKNWTGSPVSPQPAKEITLESYSYDPAGRLAAKLDAMGRKTSYDYFADDQVWKVTANAVKLNGATTTEDVVLEENDYDDAGNLTKKVTGGGFATTDYAFDAASRLTSTTLDPAELKRKTSYSYDENNLITKETRTGAGSSREEITTYGYNASGIKTRQTIENGAQDLTTTWTVDDRGLTTAIIDPRGNADGATAADFTTSNRYDALGRLIESTAPSVQVDKAGAGPVTVRPIIRRGYDAFGGQTHTVDAEGGTLTTAYDKAGRAVRLTMPAYTAPGGAAVTPTVAHGYDKAGRRTSTTDPRGYVTTTDYDALGNPVRQVDPGPSGPGGVWIAEFDLAGEQLAGVDPNGARVEATFDDLGRKITETVIERKPTTAAHTTGLTYNHAGMLTKSVEPGNKTATFVPNAAGEVKSTTDPAQNTTSSTYDLTGRPLRVTDATGNATEMVYDLAGRPTEVKDLNKAGDTLRSSRSGYDLAGNPISQTSAENHTTQQSFDALNRLTSRTEPVSATEEIVTRFGYDHKGARTKLTDGRGNTTWTTYNSLGLVEKLIEPATTQHPNEADRTWTYGYDKAGNNTTIAQPGGVQITRTYDHLGRLKQEDGAGGGAATAQRILDYDPAGQLTTAGDYTLEYNDRGLLTKLTQPTGQPSTMSYDANGNLAQRVDAAGTATFTWDTANRLKTATDPVTGRTLTYGYDKANRVETLNAANPASTQTFGYDDMGRTTSHTLTNSTGTQIAKITYGWDLDDNLTTKTTTGLAGAGTNTYGYDHANRLTSWTAPGGTTTAYEWDAAGNRTKAGDKTYSYDERNRLTQGDGTDYTYAPRGTLATQTKNGATTQLTFDAFDRLIADADSLYAYDAFDRVTSRITGATKQTHHYAGLSNDLVGISADGSLQAKYARDPFGALLSLQEGTGPAAATMSDLHGDLVGNYTATAITASTAYDPFGAVTAQTGDKASLGYQGEYTDPDTGKVNMHARWYQPGTGTFTSRDTATLDPAPSVQANRYTYANASPMVGIDPTGHATVIGGDAIAGLASYSPSADYGYAGASSAPEDWSGSAIGDCIACITAGEVITGGFVVVMTVEQVLTQQVLPNGMTTPKGFEGVDKRKQQYLVDYVLGGATEKWQVDTMWKILKLPTTKVAADGSIVSPTASNKSFNAACVSLFGSAGCGAVKDATAKAALTEKYWKECLPHPSNNTKCIQWQAELRLGEDQLRELTRLWGEVKYGKNRSSWESALNFFFGDAKDCANGSITGCVLFAMNFIPGAGIASKGVKGVIKGVGALGKSGSVIAKACSSFVPGTLVLMADGGRKPIEDVRVGDEVLATDPATGETVAKKVTALINGSGTKNLTEITIGTESAGDASHPSVVATSQHPFWVPSLKRWVDATYLQPGTWLLTSTGTWIQVADVRRWTAAQQVHNLTVADLHTYHVVAGDQAILVHNDPPLPTQKDGKNQPLTNKQATDLAKYLGYAKTNFKVRGQIVFWNKKTKTYISQDIGHGDGSHNGGTWKIADSVEGLGRKETRTATTDALLNVLKC
ncbi:RHS repeat-associated core domain-containing protein [Nonomuraea solani]|uniref:RHS repeat-associated core domain-containing protein n=1 Tax=Nonomuraea solani TaxID=1144553 RepID=A0A1H6EVJ2_9ACTN|nr:polymorphic toxin-type HINT domain-containing protein [Nonomuraea solani]SEH01782.1 RHS repeat-associated core domain-containing protein [Nonomuraea solani]